MEKKKLRASVRDVVRTQNAGGKKNTTERAKLIRRRWKYLGLMLA